MPYELDHVFIRAAKGAPEAEQLREFGLQEGSPNVHPGQGTACRRFFFHNAMLELLWVENESEARSDPASPLQLADRCANINRTASPFGICIRPANGIDEGPPFASQPYRPAYLPQPLAIQVVTVSPIEEPLLFYIGFITRPDRRQPLVHPAGLKELTGLKLITPVTTHSAAMQALLNEKLLTIRNGPDHLLELTFDNGAQARTQDFRPALPLLFHW